METTRKRPGLLLDVDGTLVDSTYAHALAWWRALHKCGRPTAMFRIHRLIGMGADRLLEGLIGTYDKQIDSEYSKQFETLKDELVAFPKVRELLSEMANRGGSVILATSAKKEQIEFLTKLIDAGDAVHEVVSSGDVDESKPAPDIFQAALSKSGLDPANSLALGDSVWDVKASAACGVRCVGLLTGGISEQELEEAGALAVYQDPEDLLANLDTSPMGALLSGR